MEVESKDLRYLFETIKYNAYMRYCNFDIFLNETKNYEVRLKDRKFKVGNTPFTILPVGSVRDLDENSVFTTFTGSHPSKLCCEDLAYIVDSYKLPTIYKSINNAENDEGATDCFKFGYMLSAVICNKVGGMSFASVCPDKDTWVWFVVMKCLDDNVEFLLDFTNMSMNSSDIDFSNYINPLNSETADEWYSLMKM